MTLSLTSPPNTPAPSSSARCLSPQIICLSFQFISPINNTKITRSNFALSCLRVQASFFHFTPDLGFLCLRAQWCFPAASGGSINNIPSPCELKSQKCFGISYWGILNQSSYDYMTPCSWPIINVPIRTSFRWITWGAEVAKSERIQTHMTSPFRILPPFVSILNILALLKVFQNGSWIYVSSGPILHLLFVLSIFLQWVWDDLHHVFHWNSRRIQGELHF